MTDPSNLERLVSQGKIAVQEGNVSRGLAIFSTVIEADPYHAEAYLMRGAAYLRLRDVRHALPDLDKAVQLGGETFIMAYQQRSLAHKALGNQEAYQADLRHVVQRRADYALRQADLAQALELYEHYLNAIPDDVDIRNQRALLCFQKGDYARSLDDYNHILRLNPRDAEAYSSRSALQIVMDKPALALVDINRAIQLNPDMPEAYTHRAHIHLLMGDNKQALADANEAIKRAPREREAYRIRAEAYYALGVIKRAFVDIRRYEALGGNPQDLAHIRQEASKHLSAQVDAETARKVEALHEEALRELDNDHYRKAERHLQQALRLAPRYAPLHITMGDNYRLQENFEQAHSAYEQALKLDENAVDAYYGRALVYLNRKKRDPVLAVQDLNRCIELDPRGRVYYRLRGMAKSYSPRPEERREAIEDLRTYLMKGGGQGYGDAYQVQKLITDLQRALDGGQNWQG